MGDSGSYGTCHPGVSYELRGKQLFVEGRARVNWLLSELAAGMHFVSMQEWLVLLPPASSASNCCADLPVQITNRLPLVSLLAVLTVTTLLHSTPTQHNTGCAACRATQLPPASGADHSVLPCAAAAKTADGADSKNNDNHEGLLAGTPKLTKLRICHCLFEGGKDDFEAGLAAAAPQLELLQVDRPADHRGFFQLYALRFAGQTLLPALTPQLTSLTLSGDSLFEPVFEALSSSANLSGLQELVLTMGYGHRIPAAAFAGLSSLTSLALFNPCSRFSGMPEQGFEPGALAHLRRLRHLALTSWLAPHTPDGTAALLNELNQMQHLMLLSLSAGFSEYPLPPAPSAAAYAALTASSTLQELRVKEWLLPAGAWQAVFAAGRELPVTSLRVDQSGIERERREQKRVQQQRQQQAAEQGQHGDDDEAPEDPPHHLMDSAAMSSMVSCCPALQTLSLQKATQQPNTTTLAPLLQLSALTGLSVDAIDDATVTDVLAHMTRLRSLDIDSDSTMTPASTPLLIQLRQLTSLRLPADAVGGRAPLTLRNEVGVGYG